MTISLPGPLVSTSWLAAHLGQPGLVVLDGSWYLPVMNRDARSEYLAGHIPGALFFDIDAHSDRANPLPHMLPDPATAAKLIGDLGVGNDDAVVVYDGSGANLSAPRVWWHFRVLGHDRIAVLDGGSTRWKTEGRPTESGQVTRRATTFRAGFRPGLVRTLDQVRAAVGNPDIVLVDARSPGRFEAREPEPRPGVKGGHIPGARNLPYGDLVTAEGLEKSPGDLKARIEQAGVDLDKPVIASCGSGVSAAAIALGLEILGHRDYAIYDGSWTEWGGREDTPIQTGPA